MRGIKVKSHNSFAPPSNRPNHHPQAMPIHTRSTIRRIIKHGKGPYGFKSISETGEGIHTRFYYGSPDPSESSKTPGWSDADSDVFSPNDSDLPTLTNSLSSISSGSFSEEQSMDCSFDAPPASPISPSKFDSYYNIPDFAPPRTASSRPLRHSSAQHWVRNPETGELRIISESSSWPSAETSSRSKPLSEDEIFEREYKASMEDREYLADLARKLSSLEELNEDMEMDTLQMFDHSKRVQVGETPQVPNSPPRSEATEIIDETFRAPPGELGVYPRRWVTHRSTRLRPQATDPAI